MCSPSQADVIDSTYLLLEGVAASAPWVRAGAFVKAGAVDTGVLLSPAFATLPDASASGSWLDGGADAALFATCCGGRRLVIPLRVSAPGYAPEVPSAAFNISVLSAPGGGRSAGAAVTRGGGGGLVAGLFHERAGAGGSFADLALGGERGAAETAGAPPELITHVPGRVQLTNVTLFIETAFRTRDAWARRPAANPAADQGEAGGTRSASVALPGGGTVDTAASTNSGCSDPANSACANYNPQDDPACRQLDPPPPARCNRTANTAASTRTTGTDNTTPSIINGAGSAYGGYGGYGGYGNSYFGCSPVVETAATCPMCIKISLLCDASVSAFDICRKQACRSDLGQGLTPPEVIYFKETYGGSPFLFLRFWHPDRQRCE